MNIAWRSGCLAARAGLTDASPAPMKSSPGHDACCGPTDLSRCCRPEFKFHALRDTYASLCVAAGIPPLEIGRFMGHARVTTTLGIYAHLFADDHSDVMAAPGAMASGPKPSYGGNVIPLHG
jgi:hypothetical protein